MVSGQKAKKIEDEPAFQRLCELMDEMTPEERQRTEEIIKKRMIKTKHAILLLITTNVITLIVLLVISFHYNVPTNLLNELGLSAPSYSTSNYRYTNNKSYDIRRSLFRVGEGSAGITGGGLLGCVESMVSSSLWGLSSR